MSGQSVLPHLVALEELARGRREEPRYPCDLPTTARVLTVRRVVIRDISAGGLCLVMDAPAEPGTVLEVFLPGHTFERRVLARVRYARPGEGGWVHGCKLARRLTAAELRELRS